jgi:oligopeptide transport system substrate-binding protein
MVLVRSKDYHGSLRGNVQRLELSFMPAEFLLQSYAADHADILKIIYAMPAAHRERARQRYPDELIAAPAVSTAAAVFDVTRPPFHDVRVRKAFVLATDRESYVSVAWDGYPLPALGGFVPPGIPGHSPGIGLPYDPDRARWLLAEAGYSGGHGFPAVEFLTYPATQTSDEYLRVQWQQNLGLSIAWESLPYSAFLSRLAEQRPHAFMENLGSGYADPDGFLIETVHALDTGWHNTEYEELIGKAKRTMNQAERMRLYRQADAILVREAPLLPLGYIRYHRLVKPWVKNYPGPWKDVIIEPH